MNRRGALRNLIGAGAAALVPGLGYERPKQEQPDFVIHSEVRLVLLDVSVKDRNGGPVAGLTIDNFRVFENGHPQMTTVFASKDLPVTVGLLVDESYSMTPKRGDVLTAVADQLPQDIPLLIHA